MALSIRPQAVRLDHNFPRLLRDVKHNEADTIDRYISEGDEDDEVDDDDEDDEEVEEEDGEPEGEENGVKRESSRLAMRSSPFRRRSP